MEWPGYAFYTNQRAKLCLELCCPKVHGTQEVVRLYDRNNQSLASVMVNQRLVVATDYFFPETSESEKIVFVLAQSVFM